MGPQMSWSVHKLEKNFQTRGARRGEQRSLARETLLEQRAGSRGADAFPGLLANFYRLRTKEIAAGRVAFGDWLE